LKRLPAHADAEIDEIFAHPQDGEPVQVSSAWERTGQSFILHWYYDHLLPDGRVERVHAETRHWLTSTESYLEEMRAAGFRSPVVYGDFDRSPLTPTSPHLIILASS
jgi:hypothetical protein